MKGNDIKFQTSLSDLEALRKIKNSQSDFMQKNYQLGCEGKASPKQWAWIHFEAQKDSNTGKPPCNV